MAAMLNHFIPCYIALLCLFTTEIHSRIIACPRDCSCLGPMVDCSSRKLTKIPPDLPHWVTMLDIQSNAISSISKDDFKGLQKLETIDLSGNKLLHIDSDTFAHLPALKKIDLGGNKLQFVNSSAFAHLPDLKEIKLHRNKLTEIPRFKYNINITHLILHHNKIGSINREALIQLPHLKLLDLSFNKIRKLPRRTFRKGCPLHDLYLTSNRIHGLSKGCLENLTSLQFLKLDRNRISRIRDDVFSNLRRLRTLDLSRNKIKSIKGLPFKGMGSLTTLKLARNQLNKLNDGLFYGLSRIQNLYLEENNLTVISHKWLFGLGTLQKLALANNRVVKLNAKGWESCHFLRILDLSSNRLSAIEESSFSHLSSLIVLDLHNNQISYIANGAFKGLDRLDKLDMNSNQISWTLEDTNGAFEELKALSNLNLEKNRIKSITKRSFRGLDELRELHLAYNAITSVQSEAFDSLMKLKKMQFNSTHFVCDCQVSWLADWLRTRKFLDSVDAKCSLPATLQGRSIYEVSQDEFQCEDDPKPYIIEHPKTQIALKDKNISLMCIVTSTSDSPMEFQWKRNNTLLNMRNMYVELFASTMEGENFTFKQILHLPDIQNDATGEYQCIVSNNFGTAYSLKAKLTVHVFPTFRKTPVDVRVKTDTKFRLECAASGQPPPEIRWQKDNGENFPAALEKRMHVLPNDDVFFIVDAKVEDQGVYSCIATNAAGTISANATITVLEPPSFEKKMENKVTTVGKTAVFECFAAGSPQPKIRWFKNNKPLVMTYRHFHAAEGQILLIKESKKTDEGSYSCEMTNSLGKKTDSANLKVISPNDGAESTEFNILDDSTMTTGIIVIAVVCCVVGTSLVWVIIIYQTRKKRQQDGYSGAPTDETTLPGDLVTPYNTDREDSSTSSVQKSDIFLDYQDGYMATTGLGRPFGHPRQQRTAAIFPSDVSDDDQPLTLDEQMLATNSQHSIITSPINHHILPNSKSDTMMHDAYYLKNTDYSARKALHTFHPQRNGSTSALVQKYNSLPPGGMRGYHDRPQLIKSESQSDPELRHTVLPEEELEPSDNHQYDSEYNSEVPLQNGDSTHVHNIHHLSQSSSPHDTHMPSSSSSSSNHLYHNASGPTSHQPQMSHVYSNSRRRNGHHTAQGHALRGNSDTSPEHLHHDSSDYDYQSDDERQPSSTNGVLRTFGKTSQHAHV